MSLAQDIIHCREPDYALHLREGNSLDDIDEYGFTPLIEAVITRQPLVAEQLLKQGVRVNKPDVTGRTALHWAVDNADLAFCRLLLDHGANPNAYTHAGLSVLVYPVLRGQDPLKQLLYQHGARLDFALDFIYGKLVGHRFELKGDVDIVNAEGEFVELDYEGFILEFTVAILNDSLRRFTSNYATRHLRDYFPFIHQIMDAFDSASQLLQLQVHPQLIEAHHQQIRRCLNHPMLILPAASRGHAMGFVRYGPWWAKIDRGENSLKEGSAIIYRMQHPERFTVSFLLDFLYKKQPRRYFHETINQQLGLVVAATLPITSQIAGNCSWANIQAILPVTYAMMQLNTVGAFDEADVLYLYEQWVEWDKDRALDECLQRFYLADSVRKASIASMLGGILFQSCDHSKQGDLDRAEKIVPILMQPEYAYILESYLTTYCVNQLTRRGNNLLKLLDDCGINPNIGVNPIATGL